MTEDSPAPAAGPRASEASLALASRVIRDIGDALVVLAQCEKTRDYPLSALIEPLREAARRNFLFVIREKDIPVAVIVLYRRLQTEGGWEDGAGAEPALLKISDWATGPQLALLELYSVRADYDDQLREKATAILEAYRSTAA